jgi:hypothetical protein
MRAAPWLCVPAAMLAVGAGALSAPAAASTATSHPALRWAPALLPAFRVDVSRYPQAARLRTSADWHTAFSQIIADLGQQDYLRFTDPVALPGVALVAVTTRAGVLHSVVQLPAAANPVAPPPMSPVHRIERALRDWPLAWLGVLLIVLILCYGIGMLAASRRDPRRLAAARQRPALAGSPGPAPPDDLFFVFLAAGWRSAPRRDRADLLYHLSSPAILLIASLLSVSLARHSAVPRVALPPGWLGHRGNRPLTAAAARWRTPCQPRSPPGTPRLIWRLHFRLVCREHGARVANPRRSLPACNKSINITK